MAGEDEAASANAIAKELTDVRRRGLADIDLQTPQQPRVAVPLLEALARRHTGDETGRRIELIKQLLQDALPAYGVAHGEQDAQLVQRLFFDDKTGAAPGPKRPIGLLQAARRDSGLGEANFDKRRRAVFRDFATFLLSFEEERPAPPEQPATPPEQDASKPGHRRGLIMLAAAVLALVVVVTVVLLARSDGGAHPTDNAVSSTSSGPPAAATPPISASAADQPGTVTFDGLGGGSAIIRVYAGVQDQPEDKRPTGTFQSGDTVRIICQTTGRTVSSDPSVGERPQQSNVWVKIDGSPGVQQYATLTYADVSTATLATLPTCADAP